MEGQTIYSTFDCLDEIFLFKSDEHEFLYNIITNYSHVMIDLEDDEFEKLINDNPFVKSLLKRPDKHIYPLKKFFDNIEDEDLSSFPRDIFLLNKSKSFCDSRIDKYGVLVLNTDNLSNVEILAKRQYRSYENGDITETNENNNSSKGWQSFMRTFNIMPVNSVVVIDNFIFNNPESGINNITNLIGSIMPQNLESNFQVLIVIDNRNVTYNFENLENLKNEIQSKLEKNVGYEINVGIVTHPLNQEFHHRFSISNYHIIKSSYGFEF